VIAIAERILGQVLLVFRMSLDKGVAGQDCCFYRLASVLFDFPLVDELLQFTLDLGRDLFLLVVAAKDGRSVLRASVVPLPILGGRVMELKEKSHQRFKSRRGIVELDKEHFHVTGSSRANLAVVGIWDGIVGHGAHETNFGLFDGVRKLLLEVFDDKFFGAPVAACAVSSGCV